MDKSRSFHRRSGIGNGSSFLIALGCEAIAEIVQTRDAGATIVDEAKDLFCALLMLGLVQMRQGQRVEGALDKTTLSVLAPAPCRVWIVQDRL
jgi:hypothetical protein